MRLVSAVIALATVAVALPASSGQLGEHNLERSEDPSGAPYNGHGQGNNRQHDQDNRQHDSNNREHYPPDYSPDCCNGGGISTGFPSNNPGHDYNNNGHDYNNNGHDYNNNGHDYNNNNGHDYNNPGQGYNNNGQGYNNNGQGYNNNGQGYNNNGQGYDNNGQGYDNNGQGYDNNGQGYNNNGQGYNNNQGHDYIPDCSFSNDELRDAERFLERHPNFRNDNGVCSWGYNDQERLLHRCHINVSGLPRGVHSIFGISDKAKRAEEIESVEELSIDQWFDILKLILSDPKAFLKFLDDLINDPVAALKAIMKLGMPTTGAMKPDPATGSTTIKPSDKRQISTAVGCTSIQLAMIYNIAKAGDHLDSFRKYHPDEFMQLAKLFVDYLAYCGGTAEPWIGLIPDLGNPTYTSGIIPGSSGAIMAPGAGGSSTTIGSGTTIGGGTLKPPRH